MSPQANPRARVGRDSGGDTYYLTVDGFQSTRPRGARHHPCMPSARGICFNPRARVGRDGHDAPAYVDTWVSIHAPAWGATNAHGYDNRMAAVSIHAPAWGATRARRPAPAPSCSFNPRARVGRDGGLVQIRKGFMVSIHAPAWGATMARPSATSPP